MKFLNANTRSILSLQQLFFPVNAWTFSLGRSSDIFSQETTRLQIDQSSLKQSRNETNCCQCLSFSFTPQPSSHQPVTPMSFIGRCTAMSLDANELEIRHFSHLNQRLRASSCLLYSRARVHPRFQLRSRIEYRSNLSLRPGALTQALVLYTTNYTVL